MGLTIFDLDNTLLGGDSDFLWGRFLVEQGLVDGKEYERKNQYFYTAYKEGRLDILEFLAFSLRPLAEHDIQTLRAWRRRFMQEKINDIILPAARRLVERHRQCGDTLMIITATNSFVTAPIAEIFGIEYLLATEPEMAAGRYTGGVSGTPCFHEGKVERLQAWLREHHRTLHNSTFYSDSHNDLPLLKRVSHPVAVDPDDPLLEQAHAQGWRIITLRNGEQPEEMDRGSYVV